MTRRPSPFEVVVDCAAVARLTRLVTADTLPPARWARSKLLARWPAPGDPVRGDPADWRNVLTPDGVDYADERGHPSPAPARWEARLPSGAWGEIERSDDDSGGWQWAKGTPLGELITCVHCSSAWIAAGVVLARRFAPALWDPVARLLAASMTAGVVVPLTT